MLACTVLYKLYKSPRVRGNVIRIISNWDQYVNVHLKWQCVCCYPLGYGCVLAFTVVICFN